MCFYIYLFLKLKRDYFLRVKHLKVRKIQGKLLKLKNPSFFIVF